MPSADPVKDVISWIIFFSCKGSGSHYIKLNPDAANFFEKSPEQKLLYLNPSANLRGGSEKMSMENS